MFKRILAVLAAVFTALFIVSTPAMAANGNAHFIKNATTASLSGSSLVVNFKETGLSSGAHEKITVTATATTTYECVNNGGKNPKASNKTTTQSPVSASGDFTADQNGNIQNSLTVSAPSASDLGFTCPSGQDVTFVSVTYSNITVTDSTSTASITLPGSLNYRNPSAP